MCPSYQSERASYMIILYSDEKKNVEFRIFHSCGEIVDEITMPTPFISAVTFGGPRLDTLVIATGKLANDINTGMLAEVDNEPPAGQLLLIKNFGVKGKTFRKACCAC